MENSAILVLVVIAAAALLIVMIAVSRLLLIAQPNEVIILSGRKRKLSDGSIVGFRMIRGGRAIKIPLLEKASRMSLETIPIELSVHNAYSKGGIPLVVDAIANIKIDATEPIFGNAVERFLTMNQEEIHAIAKDNLEGNLRGVLASLTPEEVNEDRLKFAQKLMEEADTDLEKLGLKLDTLKITNISDERGYLDSIGRMKTAEVIAQAKKAEADKKAEAEEAEADGVKRAEIARAKAKQDIETAQIEVQQNINIKNSMKEADAKEAAALAKEKVEKANAKAKQEIETAQIESQQNVNIANSRKQAEAKAAEALANAEAEKARAESKQAVEQAQISSDRNVKVSEALAGQEVETERNNLRMKKAELEKAAIIMEKEAEVAGQKAQAKYEQEMEEERIILQKKRLQADVIEPAKARKEALELEAKGEAASIIADGEARRMVLEQMIGAYLSADGKGDKVFMLQMLPQIVDTLTSSIKGINIDKITMIDSGNGDNGGNNISKLVNQLPGSVVSLSEMIENATGVDILSHFGKNKEDDAKE